MNNDLSEREEYLAWQVAVVCKLWIDNNRNEAKIGAESIRRIISRIIPNISEFERGLELITSGLVWQREAHSDLIWQESSGPGSFPWTLITQFPDHFEVRLILFRCSNGTKCGSSFCECFNYYDCDRVEIDSTTPENWDDAWFELCRLYLSWFYSQKAIYQGSKSRTEIDSANYNLRSELVSRNLLTAIEPLTKDEEIALSQKIAERHEQFIKTVAELKTSILTEYENDLPNEMSEYRQELISGWQRNKIKVSIQRESLDWALWDCISNLDLTIGSVDRIYKSAIKKKLDIGSFDQIKGKLTEAIKYLATPESESNWITNRQFDSIELTLDRNRLKKASILFEETIKLGLDNRMLLGEAEIPDNVISHSPILWNILRQLIRVSVCIDHILSQA